MNRLFDIFLSTILIILTFPIQVIIFFVLLIDLKENPLFSQERGLTLSTGRFTIFKFKTLRKFTPYEKEEDAFLKTEQTKYLTKFSTLLRKTGLDELPQIYNIFLGDMSFVGPRPFMLSDLRLIKNETPYYYQQRKSLQSKPGLTGIWQLFGERNEGTKNLVELDSLYEYNKSVKLNFFLLLQTLVIFLTEKNSDAILPNKKILKSFEFSASNFVVNPLIKSQKRMIKKLESPPTSYSIEIPSDYWENSNSVKSDKDKNLSAVKIIHIDSNKRNKTA